MNYPSREYGPRLGNIEQSTKARTENARKAAAKAHPEVPIIAENQTNNTIDLLRVVHQTPELTVLQGRQMGIKIHAIPQEPQLVDDVVTDIPPRRSSRFQSAGRIVSMGAAAAMALAVFVTPNAGAQEDENAKAIAAAPISDDLICNDEDGSWIVDNCGPEPIDESRNPGAFVAPAVAAGPLIEGIPHGTRLGDVPNLASYFVEPNNYDPNRRVHIFGARGYGANGDGKDEPSCVYSMNSKNFNDFQFVEKGGVAPHGAKGIGVAYRGSFRIQGVLQDPSKNVADLSVIYSENSSNTSEGTRHWQDDLGFRNADMSFLQYNFKENENGVSGFTFMNPNIFRDAVFVFRFHAPGFASNDIKHPVIASVACSVSKNPENVPVRPKIPYQKWLSPKAAPPDPK